MELGKKIYELRRERGVTQEELASELGVTAAAVSKWEKGNTLPDVLMVCALADHFGVTTDELLGRIRALKKLVVMAGEQDRKQIEKALRSRGFCAAAWAADFIEAKRLREDTDALCILRIGRDFMTEQEIRQAEGCSYGDCVYDAPEDLPGNLDTILAMLEKHF